MCPRDRCRRSGGWFVSPAPPDWLRTSTHGPCCYPPCPARAYKALRSIARRSRRMPRRASRRTQLHRSAGRVVGFARRTAEPADLVQRAVDVRVGAQPSELIYVSAVLSELVGLAERRVYMFAKPAHVSPTSLLRASGPASSASALSGFCAKPCSRSRCFRNAALVWLLWSQPAKTQRYVLTLLS